MPRKPANKAPVVVDVTAKPGGEAPPAKPARRPRARKAAAEPEARAQQAEAEEVEQEGEDGEISEDEIEALASTPDEEGAGQAAAKPATTTAIAPAPSRAVAPTDALQRYMREVERHPLLTREEEHALAVRLKETGDVDAAYRLVTANLRLVVKIAHEYHRNTFSLLDLVQEGNVGLMHAVRKFDPYRGVKLSSYAAWWIRAYILRYIMENWRIVKLGTTQAQRKLFFNLRKEQEKLAAQGFTPTPKLLAERLNVTEQDITDMDQRLSNDEFSLDVPVSEESGATRGDRLQSNAAGADERLGDQELKALLRQHLEEFGRTLKDKERFIFEHRLIAEEPLTLQQIGDQYGVTRERARQIEAKLVRELREYMRAKMPDFGELEIDRGE